jgi:hypothetical protein
MPSNWHDSARALFEKSPDLAGRILHDLLKVDLPPVIQYTLLTPLCWDDERGDDEDLIGEPVPEIVILAGPLDDPVRAIIVELQQGRDDGARRRWPLYAAAVWLCHGCPVDLLVLCPDELTAHWADRPVATALDGYVCRPVVLLIENLGSIHS